MKDSKKYAEKLLKLYRSRKREYGKVNKPKYEFSTDALIYAIVSENIPDSAAQSAVKKLARHFVDWNDLRVSRPEEIVDVLGKDNPEYRRIADARRGLGLAEAKDELCTACHVRIRPQVLADILRTGDIFVCDSCSRILFSREVH